MAQKIQLRRGLKKDLPALDNGEVGFTTDSRDVYIGGSDGVNELVGGKSISSQLADIAINVKEKGAVGDGLTDDTVALQDAIDNAGPNSFILLPYGSTFKCNKQLVIRNDNITLFGYGSKLDFSDVDLTTTEDSTKCCIYFKNGKSSGKVLGVELFSQKTVTTNGIQFGSVNGTLYNGHTDGKAQHCHVYNLDGHGIVSYNRSNGCVFRDNWVHDTENGISAMEGSGNCIIEGNLIEKWYDGSDIDGVYHHVHGVYLRGHGHVVKGNIIRNGGGMGVNFNDSGTQSSGQAIITDNIIYGCRDGGVNAYTATDVIVKGNWIFLNRTKGITLTTEQKDKYGITDNAIEVKVWTTAEDDYNGSTKGIINIWGHTSGSAQPVNKSAILSDNIIEDNFTVEAIRINDSSTENNYDTITIKSNKISHSGSHGIKVNVSVKNLIINDNHIKDASRTLEIIADTGEVSNNILEGGSSTQNYVVDLVGGISFTRNKVYPQGITTSGTNYPSAVRIAGTSTDNEIKGNVIDITPFVPSTLGTNRKETISCLLVYCQGTQTVIEGNTFIGVDPYSDFQNGVVFLDGAKPDIRSNKFRGFWACVYNAKDTIEGHVSYNTFTGVRNQSYAITTGNEIPVTGSITL